MRRRVAAVLTRPAAAIARVLRRFRTAVGAKKALSAKEKPEKRVAERRKGYVHGGEKKMREAKNSRRRV